MIQWIYWKNNYDLGNITITIRYTISYEDTFHSYSSILLVMTIYWFNHNYYYFYFLDHQFSFFLYPLSYYFLINGYHYILFSKIEFLMKSLINIRLWVVKKLRIIYTSDSMTMLMTFCWRLRGRPDLP